MDETVTILKALSDKNRLRMLMMLQSRPLCVCEFDGILDISYPTISANLRILKNAGLVDYRKDGKWIEYHLVSNKQILTLIKDVYNMFEDKSIFDEDKDRVKLVNREKCSLAKSS